MNAPSRAARIVRAAAGLKIAYSVAGAGETTLVFVNGGTADRSFFDGQVAAFSGRYRIVTIDLAGHGESDTGRDPWTVERAGDDVARVVEAENLDGVILFGSHADGLYRVPAAGGAVTPVTTLDASRQEIRHMFPSFLPNGRHFLYLVESAQRQHTGIYVGSLD